MDNCYDPKTKAWKFSWPEVFTAQVACISTIEKDMAKSQQYQVHVNKFIFIYIIGFYHGILYRKYALPGYTINEDYYDKFLHWLRVQ